MKKYFLLIISLVFVSCLTAQNSNIFVPLNIQENIKNGTRSYDGKPGPNYWQNGSDYKIDVEVNTETGLLSGNEVVSYHNNSPDSLNKIVVRLYQDIAKPNASRDWTINKDHVGEEVLIKYAIVNGDTLDVSDTSKQVRRSSTNMHLKLDDLILPNTIAEIKIGWEFTIPSKLKIRMGAYDNGSFYVAYWYPEIAVYDDIDGWDNNEYQGSVEFYNDFSNFDVNIKIPSDYVAWATGELVNAKNVFTDNVYEKYQQAKKSDEVVRIITQDDYKNNSVTKGEEDNFWNFKANKVTSFAFAIGNNLNWDGTSLVVDKSTNRRVLTDAVYPDSSIHWENAAEYARESIEYMSFNLPGFPYPYPHATSFCNGNRGGGMESPMMANNGAPTQKTSLIGLIFHELAHNYFPFFMGTNERKYAWMDEGWAAFLPYEIVEKYEDKTKYRSRYAKGLEDKFGREGELPLVVPSYTYKGKYLRTGFYSRPAFAYYNLKEVLGKDLFKKATLEYMNRWNGKHPLPYDFFYTFNEVAGEDLSWFWNPWFFEFGYPDLAIKDVQTEGNKTTVIIEKVGNVPTSVKLMIVFEDGTIETLEESAKAWKDTDELKLILNWDRKIKNLVLGDDYIPDSVQENNEYIFE